MIDIIKFNYIYVTGPARVGSSNWCYSLIDYLDKISKEKKRYEQNKNIINTINEFTLNDKTIKVFHGHNNQNLDFLLKNKTNNLIICGIRDPVEQIISNINKHHRKEEINVCYFKKDEYVSVKSKINFKVWREYTNYLKRYEKNKNINLKENKYSSSYLFQKYFYLIDWYNDFFSKINYNIKENVNSFDKEKGYKIINIDTNTIILYRLDKLNSFKDDIYNQFKIYLSEDKIYSSNTKSFFKNNFKLNSSILNYLLINDIYKYFYSEDEINEMYKKHLSD